MTNPRCLIALVVCLASASPAFLDAQASKPAARPQAPAKVAPPKAQPTPGSLGDYDTFVASAMRDWKVPGASIAVARDGKIILAKGYGVRDVKAGLPVTSSTLFAIGSITKSFTVTLLGTLADQGKLEWDHPVREYLPDFAMYDSVASERLSVRDLVTHRSGLPRHDALWYKSTLPRTELVRRVRYLEPSKDLRTAYQYNNLMFLTAGHVAERVAGGSWEDLVRTRILAPLEMTATNFSVADSQKAPDAAKPYVLARDVVTEVPYANIDPIGPAGSINSSADDMGRYLLMHMRAGQPAGGKSIVSGNNLLQMQMPQMVTQSSPRHPEIGHSAYGMAWVVSAYRGHKMVQHGGAIDGFLALLTFLPQDNLGIVVLSNLGDGQFTQVATYNALDRLLGLDQVSWNQRYLDDRKKNEAAQEEAKKQGVTGRREGTRPSHPIAEYAGAYEHPGYGVLRVSRDGEALELTYNGMTSPLRHFHYDYFEVPENPLDPFEKTRVSFATDLKGDIGSVAVPFEPNVKEIVFTKRADAVMRTRAFLEPFVGQYEVGAEIVTIALRGEDTLAMSVAGQPERELMPVRGTAFDVKGLPGFSIEFRKDASGLVREAVFFRPGSTSIATKKQ